MRIAIAGDIHGHLDLMYEQVLPLNPDVVIQTGDAGLFPDPAKLDHESKQHAIPLDFLEYYAGRKKIPVQTYFIKGNHDDYDFLDHFPQGKIAGLTYWPQGTLATLGDLRCGALGGVYSPSSFGKDTNALSQKRRRHFTAQDIESIARKGFDVLISHDGPKSEALPRGSEKITELIERVNPLAVFHSHHHKAYSTTHHGTIITGLAAIAPHEESLGVFLYEC